MTAVKATIRNPGEFTEGISPVKFMDRKVYGQLNISISGDWSGRLHLQRASDKSKNMSQGKDWRLVRKYRRNKEDSIIDTESGMLYRIGVPKSKHFSGVAYVRLGR